MPTLTEALAIALQHHQEGRLQTAEQIYREILAVEPNQTDALHLLGVIAIQAGRHELGAQHIARAIELNGNEPSFHSNLGSARKTQGKLDEAVSHYRRALELAPDYAEAHFNLGNALKEQGRLDQAVAAYRRALELQPGSAETHCNLGNALKELGNPQEAIGCFRRALELKPEYAEAHNGLGHVLQDLGRLSESIDAYRRALELKPEYAEAHNNLGTAFKDSKKLFEAISCFRRALELKPGYAEVHYNVGAALQDLDRQDDAVASYQRALAMKPDFPQAHNNLGTALQKQGKLDEAVACYLSALELKPNYAEAQSNLGNAFTDQGKLREAVGAYRRALEIRPDFAETHYNLGNALQVQKNLDEAAAAYKQALALKPDRAEPYSNLGNVFKDQGRLAEAVGAYRRAMELDPGFVAAHSNLLYTLYFCPEIDIGAIYEEHVAFNRQHAEPLVKFIEPHANDCDPSRRLRVGYVSPNFRLHAEAFFLVPLFSGHDHQEFEIFCYSDTVLEDDISAKLRSCSDSWRVTIGLSDEQVAELVRGDRIDILVDLTMHMANGRPLLFARKPAPIQVCWLAYQGTTGLSTMDYRLTDPHLDPPGLFDRYYSEESIRLPDSFWCYDPLANEPDVNSLPALERGYVTFGSLNNFCKVNDAVLRLWARVMRAVDGSRLIILAGEGSHRQHALEFLEQEGIATERVEFAGFARRAEYLKQYHQIDIGLDTFPYNGQTTTLDAVWMGVPAVTIIGQNSTARAGASLVRNLGMPELLAESPDRFVSIARELANDLWRLSELRCSLRKRLERSPLMDAPRFAQNVEAAYRGMWQRWCLARGRMSSL